MASRSTTLWPDWRTVLSAALIVFAFPPWGFFPLIWVSLIPFFAALQRQPGARNAFVQGLWLSILMSLGGFYWVGYVLHEFAELPWIVSLTGLILYSFIGQPQFPLFALIWTRLKQRTELTQGWLGALWAGLLGLAYAGIDWLLPKLFVDTLGHSFYTAENIRQVADIGGPTLLTFLVYIVNDAGWNFLERIRKRNEPSLWPAWKSAFPRIAVSLALVAASLVYGRHRLAEIRSLTEKARNHVQMAVIQGNIGDFDKIAAERGIRGAGKKVLETYFTLSDQALTMNPKPEVLVWPETSYPSTFRTPSTTEELARDQMIENFVRARNTPLLFGGYDSYQGKDYNAFFFLSPKASDSPSDLTVYRKNILLLFGEYIPGAESFSFIKKAFPQVGNFGRGNGPEALKVPTVEPSDSTDGSPREVRAGPIICYEALFPNYVIGAARKGSNLILNITNDSWFGPTAEPELHLSLTTFRSIETRLPQLRSTNTGISALVQPDGEISARTRVGSAEVMNVSVPVMDPIPTLMKAWGDWFGPFALAVSAIGFLAILGLKRKALA